MFFVLCTSVSSTQQPLSVPFRHQQLCFLFINFDPELSNHSKNNYFVQNETFCRWMTYFDLGTQSWVSPPPRTLVSRRYIGPIYQRKTFISPSYQWENFERTNYVTNLAINEKTLKEPITWLNVILSSLINLSSHLIFNGISLKTLVMTYLSFEIYLYVINDKDNIYQRNDLQWLGILNRTFQMCIIIVIMNLVSRRKYSRWSKAGMGKTITSSTTRSLAPGFSLSLTWQR